MGPPRWVVLALLATTPQENRKGPYLWIFSLVLARQQQLPKDASVRKMRTLNGNRKLFFFAIQGG
jgi:hypothetical protein